MKAPLRLEQLLAALAALLVCAAADSASAEDDWLAVLGAPDLMLQQAELERAFPDARDRLAASARDRRLSSFVRQRALMYFARWSDDRTRDLVWELAGDSDPQVRWAAYYTAARAFGGSADADFVRRLASGLSDPDEKVRHMTIRALRWVRHPSAHVALEALLGAPEQQVRDLAALTLKRRESGELEVH